MSLNVPGDGYYAGEALALALLWFPDGRTWKGTHRPPFPTPGCWSETRQVPPLRTNRGL